MTTTVRHDIPDEFLSAIRKDGTVAWDIETTGLDWKNCHITTCQIYGRLAGSIIVQLAEDEIPNNLSLLLSDPSVKKVFHHAPFDLGFMRHYWNVEIKNVACTKIAAKTVQPEALHGAQSLKALLQSELNISIDKTQQLSDWSVETLSPEQVAYAEADVLYLLDLHDKLCEDLRAIGRFEMYDACCGFLPTAVEYRLLGKEDIFSY